MTSRAVKPGSRRCAVQGGAWERRNCGRRRVRPKPNSPGGEKVVAHSPHHRYHHIHPHSHVQPRVHAHLGVTEEAEA